MAEDLVKFDGGVMDKGVDIFGPQFRSTLVLGKETYNVTDGLSQGIGVRYGMSPLPGQSDTETPTGTRCNNLATSEGTSTATRGFTRRTRFLRLIPVTMGEFDSLTTQAQFLAALVSKTVSGETDDYLDIVLLSDYETESGPLYFYERVRELQAGIHPSTWDGDTVDYLKTELLFVNDRTTDKLLDYFKYDSSKPYASSSLFTVSNRKIPMKWMLGVITNSGSLSSTVAPNSNLWFAQTSGVPSGTYPKIYCGLPSQNRKNPSLAKRVVKTYGINNLGGWVRQWDVAFNLSDNPDIINPGYGYDNTDEHYKLSGLTPVSSTTSSESGTMVWSLTNDDESFTESGYQAVLVCGDRPVACILQDWIYQDDKKLPLWVDLTEKILFPRNNQFSNYTENSIRKANCFKQWPAFVRGTVMVDSADGGPALTAGGVLAADTVYEIAFSFYNKRLNFETNVGSPVKVQIGSTGDRAIKLFRTALPFTSPNNECLYSGKLNDSVGGTSILDFPFMDGNLPAAFGVGSVDFFKFLNYIEYRFYYRVEGTFEWLPAGAFEAAELWFRPGVTNWAVICSGEIAALPGGQPGGFNDYSPLPKQDYRCVVNYKNRAWWISSTSIFFSLENNIFAYPTRNAITAQTGEFLGAIVHNYPGEAQQSSRLIIFASDSIYVARFTGDKSITAIRVSPNTVGEFALDGSDLVVDQWTTVSSFSQRSAVVAEGTLFYWGAQGIYRDDGTDTPVKISKRLEPDIFKFYDPTKTNEIFCTYNPTTKEIV